MSCSHAILVPLVGSHAKPGGMNVVWSEGQCNIWSGSRSRIAGENEWLHLAPADKSLLCEESACVVVHSGLLFRRTAPNSRVRFLWLGVSGRGISFGRQTKPVVGSTTEFPRAVQAVTMTQPTFAAKLERKYYSRHGHGSRHGVPHRPRAIVWVGWLGGWVVGRVVGWFVWFAWIGSLHKYIGVCTLCAGMCGCVYAYAVECVSLCDQER